MARVVSSELEQRAAYEPLYDVDLRTGASIEVFYADRVLAKSFGRCPGWFWWTCQSGFLPESEPTQFELRSVSGRAGWQEMTVR